MELHRTDLAAARAHMVDVHLVGRGIRDERVLAAMAEVPRERFVPSSARRHAYDDRPLPIGDGQTISQPYIVALMVQLLRLTPTDRLLEIGAGSGYAAAVAGRCCAEVIGVERLGALARRAATTLRDLGVGNVTIVEGDGTLGWPDGAPYDAVLVSAGAPDLPPSLLSELADGGRLVAPVGAHLGGQRLVRVRRHDDRLTKEDFGGVSFVPLIGEEGWRD